MFSRVKFKFEMVMGQINYHNLLIKMCHQQNRSYLDEKLNWSLRNNYQQIHSAKKLRTNYTNYIFLLSKKGNKNAVKLQQEQNKFTFATMITEHYKNSLFVFVLK